MKNFNINVYLHYNRSIFLCVNPNMEIIKTIYNQIINRHLSPANPKLNSWTDMI